MQQLKPVLCFVSFLQSYVHFIYKIFLALCENAFINIGPYACSTSKNLIGNRNIYFFVNKILE